MPGLRFPLFGDDGFPSIIRDLRSGTAGWALRAGLSLAMATACVAFAMLALGAIDSGRGYVQDEQIAVCVFLAIASWLFAMAWIWAGYRRWRTTVKTIFRLLGIAALTVTTCVLIESTVRRSEFFIAATILFGIGLMVTVIALAFHSNRRGNPIYDPGGTVRVNCPACGYSLVGLETCQCPECGTTTTIDAIILAQDYAQKTET